MARLYLPPKYNYSLEMMKETNYEAWERVQRLLDSLQAELFGDTGGQSFHEDLVKLLNGGMIKPDVQIEETTRDATIRFQMWSYLSNEYRNIEDMEDAEFDIIEGMLEYFARTN